MNVRVVGDTLKGFWVIDGDRRIKSFNFEPEARSWADGYVTGHKDATERLQEQINGLFPVRV